jgi:lactate dehydrogenase-like 2-hydroxyacid dehydrogenase
LARPLVLMPARMAPLVVEGLAREVELVKLWEAEDPEATLAKVAPDVGALAVGGHVRVDGAYLQRFPKLQIVSNFGVGYDAVDAVWAGEHGIVVTNTPGVLDEEVADTTLGLMLATVRQLPAAERHLRAGKWLDGAFPLTHTLRDRTVGIVGLGRIGKAVAKRAEAFGLTVMYHGRNRQSGVTYPYHATLTGLAAACDILVVITPGGPETRNLVDAAVLKALGPNGILINVARGSVVDETALIEALQSKTILGAGLDVFAEEPKVPQALLDLDHVVLLPHVGSASQHTRNAMGQLVVDNISHWAEGRPPLTPVAETPWRGSYRAASTVG